MTRRIPAPNSMAIVITRSTCAIGRPFEAIIAAVWSKPPILLPPELMKMTARRMRPTSAAALVTFGFMFFLLRLWQIEEQDVGRARLVDPDRGFALDLERVARGEAFAVDARLAADDVDIGAAAGID